MLTFFIETREPGQPYTGEGSSITEVKLPSEKTEVDLKKMRNAVPACPSLWAKICYFYRIITHFSWFYSSKEQYMNHAALIFYFIF